MDSLIKQMRVRFSDVGQVNPEESQKTPKGEKKIAQKWLSRQFSRQMSRESDPNIQMERATAVAAAAYAINESIEKSRIPDQRKTGGVPLQPSSSRVKSKKEDTSIPIIEPGRVSKWFSGENASTSLVSPDRKVPVSAAKDEKAPQKAIDPPPIKRTPTFADVALNRISSKKPEGAAPKIDLPPRRPGRTQSKPDIPPPIKPATPPTEMRRQSSTRPGTTETQANAWEKAEMAKIKERYKKLNEKILSWEERKKKKARRKMDRTESELDKRRAKALQKFRRDMGSIDQIAGGARAQAQGKQRNDELKAKEKANIIRTTGKVHATTCFCF